MKYFYIITLKEKTDIWKKHYLYSINYIHIWVNNRIGNKNYKIVQYTRTTESIPDLNSKVSPLKVYFSRPEGQIQQCFLKKSLEPLYLEKE